MKVKKDTLLAGFTLLRDLGTEEAGFSDLAIKRAIEEGLIPGPRLWVATRAIVATARYAPGPAGFAENVVLPKGAQEASGTAEVLKAVREQAGTGADWIRVYAHFNRGPAGKAVPTFSLEDLRPLGRYQVVCLLTPGPFFIAPTSQQVPGPDHISPGWSFR